LAVRRALIDNFEVESLQIGVVEATAMLAVPGQEKPAPLIALGPGQFAQTGLYTFIFQFERDAFGAVRGITVSMPEANSMAYFARE
jgi:hypothetical protein